MSENVHVQVRRVVQYSSSSHLVSFSQCLRYPLKWVVWLSSSGTKPFKGDYNKENAATSDEWLLATWRRVIARSAESTHRANIKVEPSSTFVTGNMVTRLRAFMVQYTFMVQDLSRSIRIFFSLRTPYLTVVSWNIWIAGQLTRNYIMLAAAGRPTLSLVACRVANVIL